LIKGNTTNNSGWSESDDRSSSSSVAMIGNRFLHSQQVGIGFDQTYYINGFIIANVKVSNNIPCKEIGQKVEE
jgi:hypothetical protein